VARSVSAGSQSRAITICDGCSSLELWLLWLARDRLDFKRLHEALGLGGGLGKLHGEAIVARQVVHPFTDKQIELHFERGAATGTGC